MFEQNAFSHLNSVPTAGVSHAAIVSAIEDGTILNAPFDTRCDALRLALTTEDLEPRVEIVFELLRSLSGSWWSGSVVYSEVDTAENLGRSTLIFNRTPQKPTLSCPLHKRTLSSSYWSQMGVWKFLQPRAR